MRAACVGASSLVVVCVLGCGEDAVSDVANRAPEADIAGGDRDAVIGVEMSFDGSDSTDPDGEVVSYTWDFGDGTTLDDAGAEVGHVFNVEDTFTVSLVVTDDDGEDSEPVEVEIDVGPPGDNTAPEVSIWGAAQGVAPPSVVANGVTLTFTGEATDEDGVIATWTWSFGDGTADDPGVFQGGDINSIEHTFTNPGATNRQIQVTLTVTDNGGAEVSDSITVTVTPDGANQPPTVTVHGAVVGVAPPAVIASGVTLTFTGEAYDPDGVIAAWTWNFGDGSPEEPGVVQVGGSTNEVTHTFTNGTQNDRAIVVTLTVTDDSLASAYDTTNLTVQGQGTTTTGYDGVWFWALAPGEPVDPSGFGACPFQSSELHITTNSAAGTIQVVEYAGGSPVLTYSGTLSGTTFNVTAGGLAPQTISGQFTSDTTFEATYAINTSGIIPECETPRAVTGIKQ